MEATYADALRSALKKGIDEQKTFGMKADITGRHFIFGKVKKENRLRALAIRKSIKEKSTKDKFAEAAEAMAKESSETTTEPAPSPAPSPTPPPAPGGTTPSTP